MATIIKRKSKYSVVYYYEDNAGCKKQAWETYDTHKEALARKAEVEHQQATSSFTAPSKQTVESFLADFVKLYGEQKWGVTTFDNNVSLIKNYINPLIGNVSIQDVNARFVDQFFNKLKKTHAVGTNTRRPQSEYVTPRTIEKIHKLMKCAFKQAVRWELVGKNAFETAVVEHKKYVPRDIWTVDMIVTALNNCDDSKLYIAMNLAFACTMRMGEILGLQWRNVHITDDDLAKDDAHIWITQELLRASKAAIEVLEEKEIIYIFPPLLPNTSTRIVLKTPKTDSSVRKVWLPRTVALILRKWKKSQDELKDFLGDEWHDHDLVVSQQNGRPCEGRIILKELEKLREKCNLPKVVFHSLRHSSATYKLKLSHGDFKQVEGDGGWVNSDMVMKVYSHVLDEDRKLGAQKFEANVYSNPNLHDVRSEQPKEPNLDIAGLVAALQTNPELRTTLAALLNSSTPESTAE